MSNNNDPFDLGVSMTAQTGDRNSHNEVDREASPPTIDRIDSSSSQLMTKSNHDELLPDPNIANGEPAEDVVYSNNNCGNNHQRNQEEQLVSPKNDDLSASSEEIHSTGTSAAVDTTNDSCDPPTTLPESTAAPEETDSSSDAKRTAMETKETIVALPDQSQKDTTELEERIAFLELELAKAESMVETLQIAQKNTNNDHDILMELQNNLQTQMSLKAEAENRARIAEAKIQELQALNQSQAQEIEQMMDWQGKLETQMNAKAEAENKARLALEHVQVLEKEKEEQKSSVENLQREIVSLREETSMQQQELGKLRAQRDEQERKEIALTNRLNAAKKNEAEKANLAEQYEDDIKAAEQEAADAKQKLEEFQKEKVAIEDELSNLKKTTSERIRFLELSLAEERQLNEDRKQKMKAFVGNKAEELRIAKADADALQQELDQTNRSLIDLNNRWKQLHAQWVQSQTRNRELQRDLNKIKKDSENLHKVGDTLEMKLSKSATETEEHKNKRLAAKNELMNVLKTLETERGITRKLRDSIKYTFTPKALSQQQLLKENLDDFEAQLVRLSTRLGKPLPPLSDTMDSTDRTYDSVEDISDDDKRSEADIQNLIAKLEHETQSVSKCIMAFATGIERMHLVLDASGARTCYAALSEIIAGKLPMHSTEEATAMAGDGSRRLTSIRSHSYGHIPHSAN